MQTEYIGVNSSVLSVLFELLGAAGSGDIINK